MVSTGRAYVRLWRCDRYRCSVSAQRLPGGVMHAIPTDFRHALLATGAALAVGEDVNPPARNELIPWVVS